MTTTEPSARPGTSTIVDPIPEPLPVPYERIGFGWNAVSAGLAVAIGLDLLFAEAALGLGLGLIDADADAQTIMVGGAIAWVLTGAIALGIGAWIAGRLARTRDRTEGALHGIAVWAAGALLTLLLAVSAFGALVGGGVHLIGKAISGAGTAAQVALPGWGTIRSELERAVETRPALPTAVGALDDNRLIDRSRLFELAARHYSPGGQPLDPMERAELTRLIAGQAGLSQEAAERTLRQWDHVWADVLLRYEHAKAEASAALASGRRLAAAAASWTAMAMFIGLAVAAFAGAAGASCRLRGQAHAATQIRS